jgi:hypothetical protein
MTKADQKRLEIIHRLPCMACVQIGQLACGRVEAHHIVDKGYRKHSGGHQATIPLGAWHHRGEPLMGHTKRYMQSVYGPSLALQSKHFAITFGSQRELLANIDKVING